MPCGLWHDAQLRDMTGPAPEPLARCPRRRPAGSGRSRPSRDAPRSRVRRPAATSTLLLRETPPAAVVDRVPERSRRSGPGRSRRPGGRRAVRHALRRPSVPSAYWTPVMTSVVAPVLAAPWQPRQSASSVGWLRSNAPFAVWARWQPAQLSAVSELTPELVAATWGPPSARAGTAARNSQRPPAAISSMSLLKLSSPPFSLTAGVSIGAAHLGGGSSSEPHLPLLNCVRSQ